MRDLAGKVAVVTGSGSGLGLAMAERLAREGMTVVIVDNRLDAAEVVATRIETHGGRASPMQVDVTKRDSVIALADRVDDELGGASVLVNNAGVAAPSPLLEPEESGWRWVMDVNVFGVLYGIQTFVPRMLASGEEAHVVNTASYGGVIGPACFEHNRTTGGTGDPEDPGPMKSYMVSKHGVVALSEGLAGELTAPACSACQYCALSTTNPAPSTRTPRASGRPSSGARCRRSAGSAAEAAKRRHEGSKDATGRGLVERRFEQILAGFDDAGSFTGD